MSKKKISDFDEMLKGMSIKDIDLDKMFFKDGDGKVIEFPLLKLLFKQFQLDDGSLVNWLNSIDGDLLEKYSHVDIGQDTSEYKDLIACSIYIKAAHLKSDVFTSDLEDMLKDAVSLITLIRIHNIKTVSASFNEMGLNLVANNQEIPLSIPAMHFKMLPDDQNRWDIGMPAEIDSFFMEVLKEVYPPWDKK